MSRAFASALEMRPDSSSCRDGSRRSFASWRNSSASPSFILLMRSAERATRLEISSSSRRMSRIASSRLASACGPLMLMVSPLRHRAAQDGHLILNVEEAIGLPANDIALDDAIVALVGSDGVIDALRHADAPHRDDVR